MIFIEMNWRPAETIASIAIWTDTTIHVSSKTTPNVVQLQENVLVAIAYAI